MEEALDREVYPVYSHVQEMLEQPELTWSGNNLWRTGHGIWENCLHPEVQLALCSEQSGELPDERPGQPWLGMTSKSWTVLSLGYQPAPDLGYHFMDEVTSLTLQCQLNNK